jgi:hypothetical protein
MNDPRAARTRVQNRSQILNRRAFLKISGPVAGVTLLTGQVHAGAETRHKVSGLVDVNIHLSRWPMRRVAGGESTTKLCDRLKAAGVLQAWAGSFDGLLHKDIGGVNTWLTDECRFHGRGMLLPVGTINPNLPDWEEELRRCMTKHQMRIVRLYPSYHGYSLADAACEKLLRSASEHSLIVQLVVAMEDERMMHPLLRVGKVNLTPLPALLNKLPTLRLVLLNAGKAPVAELSKIISAGQAYVEIAMIEGLGGISRWLAELPLERILFGSHAPLFYFPSAALKLKESSLTPSQVRAITFANAARLLALRS